jgi:hypothetical protein
MSVKLHIGAGSVILEDWINIDLHPGPGIDRVLDVTEGIPFQDVSTIFAEHFLEHLPLPHAIAFLRDCRRALRDDGIVRLTTPNLDWVWLTHYRRPEELAPADAVLGCLEINRAFHGWGHRFLWNGSMLDRALRAAGFADVKQQTRGESAHPALRGVERHDPSPDLPDHPHILIVEASGRAAERPWAELEPYLRDLEIA